MGKTNKITIEDIQKKLDLGDDDSFIFAKQQGDHIQCMGNNNDEFMLVFIDSIARNHPEVFKEYLMISAMAQLERLVAGLESAETSIKDKH